jgi:cyclophilin family peptidyl-prolyl cis-trans isomerase
MKKLAIACLSLALLGAWACAADKKPVVIMETSLGTIKIELDPERAPITVKNFLQYVDDKHYDGTVFHRVIKDFMIQGGGYEPGLKEKKTREPIKNESGNGLSNVRGSIAMARTNQLDSATSQFYINTVDNSSKLDRPKYCVFGKVIEGMDVVDKIRAVETTSKGGHDDVPAKDVVIKSVRRAP